MKKNQHKVSPNTYTTNDQTATLTVLNKKGKELHVTFDVADLSIVSENGPYFAQWHKDYNDYFILTQRNVMVNGRERLHKIPLATIILGVSSTTPVLFHDQSTLNLCRDNLSVYNRFEQNDYCVHDNQTVSITLKNKYGLHAATAIIDEADLASVITPEFSWTVQKRLKGQPSVVANTPSGRVYLSNHLLTPAENERVVYSNKNPLDHRRQNLRVEVIELDEVDTSEEA